MTGCAIAILVPATTGLLALDRDAPFTRSACEPLFERLGKWFAQPRWVPP